jgi:hypothetical protein
VFVPESKIDRVADLVEAQEHRWEAMGKAARGAWEDHMASDRRFHAVGEAVESLLPDAWLGRWALAARWPYTVLRGPAP